MSLCYHDWITKFVIANQFFINNFKRIQLLQIKDYLQYHIKKARRSVRVPNDLNNLLVFIILHAVLQQLAESLVVSLSKLLLYNGNQFLGVNGILLCPLTVVAGHSHDLLIADVGVNLTEEGHQLVVA